LPSRRRFDGDRGPINRLYSVESSPTNTGTRADHRLPLRASQILTFARAVAAQLGVAGVAASAVPDAAARWIAPLVKDLQANRGKSVVIAGDGQPAAVHALAHAMNDALGNVGATVTYTQTAEARPMNQLAGLQELVGEMNAGQVRVLLIFSGNPVYSAPVDLNFGAALAEGPVPRARRPLRGRDRSARASGTSPKRISSKCGATCGPTTAR
jgi:molybdopterin-containing oxidoreductase family iron-sulfur binding subunit